jgi:hypothetical protein
VAAIKLVTPVCGRRRFAIRGGTSYACANQFKRSRIVSGRQVRVNATANSFACHQEIAVPPVTALAGRPFQQRTNASS